ncbi:hypothetical protein [Defluviimonas sp. WL0075]|uniref:Integral membrane protein n=1 Tax=Albidovulum sediminicola TaxID=2984331 RepID=A0ABT2YYH9_9RHOB|nr:hypothetical protein [Defluviimonas sp. WL0075]MCV2863922.1 hypothetical protein [Defluviimonas sp. WL0075]
MSFVRPDLMARFAPWREAAAAFAVVALGLWLIWLGGYLLVPLGVVVGGLGLAWAVIAIRRRRFGRRVEAPGMVEVDEGQIGYLGPTFGGYVAVRELSEIRLIDIQARRHWRLRQADGQVLLIPVAAAGAERLYDAFAVLPGIDLGALSRALDARESTEILWRRPAHAALT